MKATVNDAKRVGRYLSELCNIFKEGSEEDLLRSDLTKRPQKVINILLSLHPEDIITLLVRMNIITARVLVGEGFVRDGIKMIEYTLNYLDALKQLIAELERELRHWAEAGDE